MGEKESGEVSMFTAENKPHTITQQARQHNTAAGGARGEGGAQEVNIRSPPQVMLLGPALPYPSCMVQWRDGDGGRSCIVTPTSVCLSQPPSYSP